MDIPLLLLVLLAVLLLATTTAAAEPGLAYVLFNDTALQRPAEHGVDRGLNMTLTGYNDCSRLWLGYLTLPQDAEVTLEVEVEQGARVYVDGKAVIDAWAAGSPRRGAFGAKAGHRLPLRVEYWHLGGEAYLRLYWSWAGHQRELVPPSAFSHDAADAAHAVAIMEGKEQVAMGNVGPMRPVVSAPAGDEEFCSSLYAPGHSATNKPLRLARGPHLFIDDYLIASSSGLKRTVNRPRRDPAIPNPIVTGKEDRCFQPFMSVLRDPQSGLFRLWYGMYDNTQDAVTSHLGYMESSDGIHWQRPARQLEDAGPIQFGDSVIDEGPDWPDQATRYKVGWWKDGGLMLATSPDGLEWKLVAPYPVLRHNHDIVNVIWDPLRKCYVTIASVYTTGPTWQGLRRCTMISTSTDMLNWSKPWYVITPQDGTDEGETQFYAMDGHLVCGDLWIGLVKVLRDDLKAPGVPEGAYGVGYTTLAWTRDGKHWVRDREPFFEPDPDPAAWDHAHAWMDDQVLVDDEVFIYYGGYKSGHKWNRFEERQIGLVRMPRDRYVAREAGEEEGVLTTPPLVLEGKALTVNAEVTGELRVAVFADGKPVKGMDFADCQPIRGDALDHPVAWRGAKLPAGAVTLQFRLRDGRLYGFDLR